MKEIDTIVGGFVEDNIASLSDADMDALEILLDEPDNDVLTWVLGREDAPVDHQSLVMRRLVAVGTGIPSESSND